MHTLHIHIRIVATPEKDYKFGQSGTKEPNKALQQKKKQKTKEAKKTSRLHSYF